MRFSLQAAHQRRLYAESSFVWRFFGFLVLVLDLRRLVVSSGDFGDFVFMERPSSSASRESSPEEAFELADLAEETDLLRLRLPTIDRLLSREPRDRLREGSRKSLPRLSESWSRRGSRPRGPSVSQQLSGISFSLRTGERLREEAGDLRRLRGRSSGVMSREWLCFRDL